MASSFSKINSSLDCSHCKVLQLTADGGGKKSSVSYLKYSKLPKEGLPVNISFPHR